MKENGGMAEPSPEARKIGMIAGVVLLLVILAILVAPLVWLLRHAWEWALS